MPYGDYWKHVKHTYIYYQWRCLFIPIWSKQIYKFSENLLGDMCKFQCLCFGLVELPFLMMTSHMSFWYALMITFMLRFVHNIYLRKRLNALFPIQYAYIDAWQCKLSKYLMHFMHRCNVNKVNILIILLYNYFN